MDPLIPTTHLLRTLRGVYISAHEQEGRRHTARFAAAARADGTEGRVTVLVSHRFSTVRMADLVLDGRRVVEVGGHEELMARGGQYAELYGIQARAYRG